MRETPPTGVPAPDPGQRGRLKVYLGMAAGVGKTYRMLLEGHAEHEAGRDVVIGLLETHGRAETARLAEGLPILPRRRVAYRESVLEEMDLDAVLTRAPELCLIDELAVNPEDVVHPGLLGGWLVSKPPVPRRTPDEAAR